MKTIKYLSMYIFVFACTSVFSQEASLKVGDDAPPLSVFKWIKGTPVSKLEPGKIYILEFGATWCGPCAAAIPKLSALQAKYPEVQVISLFVKELNIEPLDKKNPAYVTKVENYVKKRSAQMNYTIAVDDPRKKLETTWLTAAHLTGIPYTFMINEKGKIEYIGNDLQEVEQKVIEALHLTDDLEMIALSNSTATEQPSKVINETLVNQKEHTDGLLYRSLISKYNGERNPGTPGFIQSAFWLKPDSLYDQLEDKVDAYGSSLKQLYYLAYADTFSNQVPNRNWWNVFPDTIKEPFKNNSYGKYWHKPVLEVTDETPFQAIYTSNQNRYTYRLKVPKGTGTSEKLQLAMRSDLATYFGYNVTVEIRMMPYWKLTVSDQGKAMTKLRSKDQSGKYIAIADESPYVYKNAIMKDMISRLGRFYGYGSEDHGKVPIDQQASFRDETQITYKIDFTFDRNLSFEQIKQYLLTLGLELTRSERPMKVVVIRDPSTTKR